MNAIRQTVEVKNHQINILLPEDFDADIVEVIVLPKEGENELFYVSEEEKKLMLDRVKNSNFENAQPWSELRKKYIKNV